MFDIAAAKRGMDIERGKSEIQEHPRANPANCANPEGRTGHIAPEISTFSTISTPPPLENENVKARLERIAKERIHPVDDLLDWCKDDLADLAGRSDKDLQFIVCEYLDNLTRYRGAPVETFKPHTVTCETCQHFTRGNHAHLGGCAAGVKGALLGLWDTHLRGCDKYREDTHGIDAGRLTRE